MATDPALIATALEPYVERLQRVGHEAGSLSPWLRPELVATGLPAICLETRRDGRPAQQDRRGRCSGDCSSHPPAGFARLIKSQDCYRMRLLLTHRRNLKAKFLDLENAPHSLKAFCIRLRQIGRGGFAKAVLEAVAGDAMTLGPMQAMLGTRRAVGEVSRPAQAGGAACDASEAVPPLH